MQRSVLLTLLAFLQAANASAIFLLRPL